MKLVVVASVVLVVGCKAVGAGSDDGCTKDTDCKGSRVCRSGQCVEDTAAAVASQAAAQAIADQAAKEKAARALELQHLMGQPSAFIVASNPEYYDKGIINSYRSLAQVTLLNRSHFPVSNPSGTVDWTNAAGASAGSTPFSVTGVLGAGESKTFSRTDHDLTSGTVEAGVTRAVVTVTHVTVTP